jgi:hypothetical protein
MPDLVVLGGVCILAYSSFQPEVLRAVKQNIRAREKCDEIIS